MKHLRKMAAGMLFLGAFGYSNPLTAQEIPEVWNLENSIRYALENNITVQRSRLNAESSYVDVKTAKAALFPSLSFSISQNVVNYPYNRTYTDAIDNGDGTYETYRSSDKTTYSGSYGLNSSWTLYNGSRRLKTIEQQKINYRISELDLYQSENSIEEAITQAYIQILYAAESVRINESTLELSEAQRDRARVLLEVGQIALSDLAQLESQYSNDKYQLINAQAALENYKLQLKQLLELDFEQEMIIAIPELEEDKVLTPLPTVSDVFAAALGVRPEIEATRLGIQASEIGIDIAKAAYMPTVSLNAEIGTNHVNGSDYGFGEQLKHGWNNALGLSVSVPIFNNRQTKSAVEKARIEREASMLDMLNEEKNLYSTVEGIWLDANTAQQRYLAARETVNSAEISYDLVRQQFELGMKNTVELLTEMNNLLASRQELVQAKYMAILNAQLLRFYQGESISL